MDLNELIQYWHHFCDVQRIAGDVRDQGVSILENDGDVDWANRGMTVLWERSQQAIH